VVLNAEVMAAAALPAAARRRRAFGGGGARIATPAVRKARLVKEPLCSRLTA
jgi:hypothetical protein